MMIKTIENDDNADDEDDDGEHAEDGDDNNEALVLAAVVNPTADCLLLASL